MEPLNDRATTDPFGSRPVIGHPAWVSADRCAAPYTVSKQIKPLYQLPDVSGAVESSAIKAAL